MSTANVTNIGDDDTLMLKMKKKFQKHAEAYRHLFSPSCTSSAMLEGVMKWALKEVKSHRT